MELQILDSKTKQKICTLDRISANTTIDSVKEIYQRKFPNYYPERQSFKSSPKGKSLKGSETLNELNLGAEGVLYFKDLGPQVGWSTVFYCEYTGPLFVYLLFYFRLPYIYDSKYAFTSSPHDVVHLAAICHSFHYLKRVLETKFVHRFSHGTMPIKNLFRNCSYYWSFAAWMSYYINHPLYTPAAFGTVQIFSGLAAFVFCELGNLSIHLAFRSLRPSGSTQRKIPTATGNPFTLLFNFVSCPNYTYEFGSWFAFAVITQTLPVLIFAFVGFGQMAIWALGKHKNYKREFSNYPRSRKAILPVLL